MDKLAAGKAAKRRYFQKIYRRADWINCGCGQCGRVIKDHDRYGRPKRFVSGHNTERKYDDPTQFKREWNHRNRRARYNYKKAFHKKRRAALIETFGAKCTVCKVEYDGSNACIFHFHHIIESTKLFSIGNQITNKSWRTILIEAAKCELLCANCHSLRHEDKKKPKKGRRKYVFEWSQNRKAKLINCKGNACETCGMSFTGINSRIFHFHHRVTETKNFILNLTSLCRYSWQKIVKESKKCALLCNNCHEMVHSSAF